MNNKFELSNLAKALMFASGMGIVPGISHAAFSGSLTGSEINLADGTVLVADKSDSTGLYGILVPAGTAGTVTLGSSSTIRVTDDDHYAEGILLQAADSRLTADKLIVNVAGKSATGIYLSGKNSSADLGSTSSVSTVGTGTGFADAIMLSNASSLQATSLQISTQGSDGIGLHVSGYGSSADIGDDSAIQTNGTNSYGIMVDSLGGVAVDGGATLTASSLTINTLGDSSEGIDIQPNSSASLGSHSTIITSGRASTGIWDLGELTADHLTISTSGAYSNGLEVRESGVATIGAGSLVSSVLSGGIVAMDDGATLNFLGSVEEHNTVQSKGSYGVSAQSVGSTVNVQNTDVTINPDTGVGVGLWATQGGVINGDALTITGASNTYGVYSMADSQINLTGDLTIDMGSPDGVAMATQHDDGYAPSVINADGKMTIAGSVASLGGLIDLNFAPGSLWSGSAVSDNVNDGHLNLNLTDSEWRVASSSNVDNLQMSNSLVDLSAATDSAAYSTLTIANLSGSGDFTLRTDIAGDGNGVNQTGDKIVVTGSSAGDYGLTIQNRGGAITNGSEVLTVVETPDGVATFKGNTDVELGGYVYTVNKQGTNWVLSSPKSDEVAPVVPADNTGGSAVTPADDAVTPADSAFAPADKPVTPVPSGTGGTPAITTTANAGANFLNLGYLMNYAETQTLLQRMGDVRQGKTAGNVWLRGMDGRFSGFASGKMSDFSMNYTGYQFGVDKRLSEEVPVYLGLFMGVTEGSPHYKSGDGNTKSEHVGLYGTWLNDAGFYVDGVVKFNRLRNQFSVRDTQDNKVSGSGASYGISASLEAGKKFSFSDAGAGFYLEPQLQLTAGHQESTTVNASNGLNIDLSNYKSLLGRASVLAGYEINQSDYKLNAYLKTGVMHEYEGDAEYRLNGSKERLSFQGSGWNNGLGISAQLRSHTLFLEADMVDGDRFNQRQVNAGYRFSF